MARFVAFGTLLCCLLCRVSTQLSSYPFSPPSWPCSFQGAESDLGEEQNEVALSVSIEGNPAFYVPGNWYQVSLSSSMEFNGISVTGLYTTPQSPSAPGSNSVGPLDPAAPIPGAMYLCSLIHQQMMRVPQQDTFLYWVAPQEGSGCVSFMVTAFLRQQMIVKDALTLQLCEKGMPTAVPFRPQLASVHSDGVILRDDFDSSDALDYTVWSEMHGGNISNICGTVLHGKSMVFCNPLGRRELSTVHLNLTSASVLQFALSSGVCKPGIGDYSLSVSYAINDRVDWHLMERIRVPIDGHTTTHVVHLPSEARKAGVCLRLDQDLAMDVHSYYGCWALDNVLITSTSHRPVVLEESFDPISMDNWLFFPGGGIEVACQSDGNALFFHSRDMTDDQDITYQFVTTHDLNLYVPATDLILEEHIDSRLPANWNITGGQVSEMCGTVHSGTSLVFSGDGDRSVCTPNIDASEAGNIRFYFTMGGGDCDPGDSTNVQVDVLAQVHGMQASVLLNTLAYNSFRKPHQVSVAVPPTARTPSTKFCFQQRSHYGPNRNVWAVDEILILPLRPQNITHQLQFDLSLDCNVGLHDEMPVNDSRVQVEFSTDRGRSWTLVRAECLPGTCQGSVISESSAYGVQDIHEGWARVILPLPSATLTANTRFRWKQEDPSPEMKWGIDNVYIGSACSGHMCTGHGQCTSHGCRCDPNFSGYDCSIPLSPLATNFTEDFETFDPEGDFKFSTLQGASVGYDCGVLASGKALVFNEAGKREIVTQELNSTDSRFLQFTIRIGSHSSVGTCASPDDQSEGLLLFYSCNNGIEWHLLKHMEYDGYRNPRSELVHLPLEARGPTCRYRWWQPSHSGRGRDVWALDGMSLTSVLYNSINVDMNDDRIVRESLSFHLGEVRDFCKAARALVFSGPSAPGGIRYAETQSLHIGASYILQFDLVMGCGEMYAQGPREDKRIYLEYSSDHGLSWELVTQECLPGHTSCLGNYHQASVYDYTQYGEWTRVTVLLPLSMRSGMTRFRWRQSAFSESDSWAIDNIYIGRECPELCHGHGRCVEGICRCDGPLYTGDTCMPVGLPSSVQSDFNEAAVLLSDWRDVHGAISGEDGCGIITSGSSLYFYGPGVRELVSHDLNTATASFVQFYIRLGGDISQQTCRGVDRREEGVLLQYSNDGGITWTLLLELYYSDYRNAKFVHQKLPESAKTANTRFHWWQPRHSGAYQDQWALDDVYIGNDYNIQTSHSGYLQDEATSISSLWMTVSNGEPGNYCNSHSSMNALVFNQLGGDRFAVTRKMTLKPGHVLQFKIVIGCRTDFTHFAPVYLQYSHDSGLHWNPVIEACYPSDQEAGLCTGVGHGYTQGSAYHMGQYDQWTLVVIQLPEHITQKKTQFRWVQADDKLAPLFSIGAVYIGEACPANCLGHGVCNEGKCLCDSGYSGDSCEPVRDNPRGIVDSFDSGAPNALWDDLQGGTISQGCGMVKMDSSLYFGLLGPREARTVPLNTTAIKILQFYLRIGSANLGSQCMPATSRSETVIVQFSTDNGLTWRTLREIDPTSVDMTDSVKITIELSMEAKTNDTVFRWWQPFTSLDDRKAQWALDNVLIGANDTHAQGFYESFEVDLSNNWYSVMSGTRKTHCQSRQKALVFEGGSEVPRYAETWDFDITPATFLQFELIMGCNQSEVFPSDHPVILEYSIDMGRSWHHVKEECIPPDIGCGGYDLGSVYAEMHTKWSRVTVYLPEAAVSPSTRFRWSQPVFTSEQDVWALDSIHLGSYSCPWMCSGHGGCHHGQCLCDAGFGGSRCVPNKPFPKMLKDNFEGALSETRWASSYGVDIGNMCGILLSGTAAVFRQAGPRMLVTHDLDCTMMEYIQFTFQYSCPSHTGRVTPDRSHAVLVQYSNNGGTTWELLQELYYTSPLKPTFFNIKLPLFQNNATKFRFWQPRHSDGSDAWSIDGLIIGGNLMGSNILAGNFESGISEADWLFYPGGQLDRFCPPTGDPVVQSTHSRWAAGSSTGLVYRFEPGEHSVTTRDIHVNENTMVQFEINLGCTLETISADPIFLEFSRDHGSTWNLLKPDCFSQNWSSSVCSGHVSEPSVYYIGELKPWKRVTILMNGLHICGTVRFRWYQGFFKSQDRPHPWALDNVYIGPLCRQLCNGHGACDSGNQCICDEGYGGSSCYAIRQKPRYLKEEFEDQITDGGKFVQWSGAEVTSKCGTLITGTNLHFVGSGKRMLVTRDLNLTTPSIVHFFIRLGCQQTPPSTKSHPVLLQYSTNGGITWNTLEEMDFNNHSSVAKYVMLELPGNARSNATRVRWWQPSHQGSFLDDWAIDQIFIGSHGQAVLQDDFDSSMQRDSNEITSQHDQNWLLSPGGVMEPVCDSGVNAIHFHNNDIKRYLVSTDVLVTEGTFLQFELTMGCTRSNQCYTIDLEYSVDMGKHWYLVYQDCQPSNLDCTHYHPSSQFGADVYSGWNRVVVALPAHTRSKATQFRWRQPDGFEPLNAWALSYVYIGSQCKTMCSGHGRCNAGYCVCDSNWQGPACETPIRPLPQQIREPFSQQIAVPPASNGGIWLNINGGMVSSACGRVASGKAMHFTGACTRQLVTTDLDLSTASHIQFYIRYGCLSLPSQRDQNVLLQYSTNGGILWTLLSELHYAKYKTPSFVSIQLPSSAKTVGTQLSWWQPTHPGANQADWAIDNVLIGGSSSGNRPTSLSDDFNLGITSGNWLFLDNADVQESCSYPNEIVDSSYGSSYGVGEEFSLVGGLDPEEGTVITTVDLQLQEGMALEFKINTACNASWDSPFNPVHLMFSTDSGITWSHLVQQCLPSNPLCNGVVTQSSSYYIHRGWRRIVIPLPLEAVSGSTRFRWIQESFPSSLPQRWSLDAVSIGPSCPLMCSGHGTCVYPQCICDQDFTGSACEESLLTRNGLKETFLGPDLDSSAWHSVQGGSITMSRGASCGTVSEGWSLYFNGSGLRMAETVDLDLRDARFVQYHAVIGSELNIQSCRRAVDKADNVLLQYSTNGGITWFLLAELYYERYTRPRHDYITLPSAARTQATRLRWWQSVTNGQQAQWALDDIYIGGSEINPNQLTEAFDVGLTETLWEFHPYGQVRDDVCLNGNSALYWSNQRYSQRDNVAVTRQLIIDTNYMLQFRIVIGCQNSASSCTVDFPINLEYRTNPSDASGWVLLRPSCLPDGGDSLGCEPSQYHQGSSFTANEFGVWRRLTYALSPETVSSSTQFRWIQHSASRQVPTWSLDDVYIGAACPSLCSGHGTCDANGRCRCDHGFIGDKCIPERPLPHRMNENFEAGVSDRVWASVKGGRLGMGCGALVPHAHGKSLYFSQCGVREAVTVELDTSRAREIMFVLQIGSTSPDNPSCSVNLTSSQAKNKAVLLQYTANNGIDWDLIEIHDPSHYRRAQRLSYRLPEMALGRAVQFRWWQPQHDGAGQDQWAIDHVQLVMPRRAMLKPYN